MMSRDAVRAIDRAAATYAAGQPDPIGAYRAYLAGALAALQQVRADLLAPRPVQAKEGDVPRGPVTNNRS